MRIAVLVLAFAVAAPVQAGIAPSRRSAEPAVQRDPFLGSGRIEGPGIYRDVGDIRDRIDDGRESGALSRREARRLDRQARSLAHTAQRYGRDGLSASEARELEARARYLRDAVNAQRSGAQVGGSKQKRKGR